MEQSEKMRKPSLCDRFINLLNNTYINRYYDLKSIIDENDENSKLALIKDKQQEIYLNTCKISLINRLVLLPNIISFKMSVPSVLSFVVGKSNLKDRDNCINEYNKLDSTRTFIDTLDTQRYAKTTSQIKISKTIIKQSKLVSRAYYKLMELITTIQLNKYFKHIQAHHSCEAPGMFIIALKDYCTNHRLDYNWTATTIDLNIGLQDTYGIIRNNKTRWRFFDIRDISYLRRIYNTNINLYTADVGLPDDTFGNKEQQLKDLQLHAYLKGLACLQLGGILISKMYAPCLSSICQFILNHAYRSFRKVLVIKPSLNPSSHEFYLICIHMQYKESYTNLLEYSSAITKPEIIVGMDPMIQIMQNTIKWINNSLILYQLSDKDLNNYINQFRNRYNTVN